MSNKKDIKAWLERMSSDEEFNKKFDGIEDEKEVVALAKKEGYNFTEEELADLKMEAVSGGFSFRGLFGKAAEVATKGAQKLNDINNAVQNHESKDVSFGISFGKNGITWGKK